MKNPRVSHDRRSRGFSLVVTLLMMVLLTLVALGMLSLSTISLRAAGHADAMMTARANARMAMMVALGELQKQTGPDQRVTVAADQLPADAEGTASAAKDGRRFWTGVYQSWDAASTTRPTPKFLSWLVSGDPGDTTSVDLVKSDVSGGSVKLVGEGTTAGTNATSVQVPVIEQILPNGTKGHFAWWVGDQGVKASIATPDKTKATDLAATRQSLMAVPRNAVEVAVNATGTKAFAPVNASTPTLKRVTQWKQSELLASSPEAARPLFHDLTAHSGGLLTNVRAGGFRKDLSLYLEPALTPTLQSTPLYTAGGSNGINQGELWAYYNLYKELKTGGNFAYTTGGGSIDATTPYLQLAPTKDALLADPTSLYKEPSFVSTKTILSFYGRPSPVDPTKTRLCLVVDPIVVYWNPLDVPLVITPAYHSIKYWQLPYSIHVKHTGEDFWASMGLITAGGSANYMTLVIGKTTPVVLRPGEVVMFSQGTGSPIPKPAGTLNVDASPGWNFGSGVYFDIKNGSNYVDLPANDTVTYEIAPNHLQGTGSQNWFLTANDIFYKEDRANGSLDNYPLGCGLSIDNMGGKPASRIYADEHLDFFGKINPSDTRPITTSELVARKAPLMIFSYSAKTEQGSDRSSRYLARYNPKAGTDFQTLAADELETFPYEVHIEPLNSWKNRNFEVSPNGSGFFGGGMTAQNGVGGLTTHSVPREPLNSLAAFQNAMANGFTWSGNTLNQGGYLAPQISHAIGNSIASPVIPAGDTTASGADARPLADHSYLANQALWDDWFLSGIAPQMVDDYASKRSQRQVAQDFFKDQKPLPNSRYLPVTPDTGETPDQAAHALVLRQRCETGGDRGDRLGPRRGWHVQCELHLGSGVENLPRGPQGPVHHRPGKQRQGCRQILLGHPGRFPASSGLGDCGQWRPWRRADDSAVDRPPVVDRRPGGGAGEGDRAGSPQARPVPFPRRLRQPSSGQGQETRAGRGDPERAGCDFGDDQ